MWPMKRKLVTRQSTNKTVTIFEVFRLSIYHKNVLRLYLYQLTIIQNIDIKIFLELLSQKVCLNEVFYLLHLGGVLVPVVGSRL